MRARLIIIVAIVFATACAPDLDPRIETMHSAVTPEGAVELPGQRTENPEWTLVGNTAGTTVILYGVDRPVDDVFDEVAANEQLERVVGGQFTPSRLRMRWAGNDQFWITIRIEDTPPTTLPDGTPLATDLGDFETWVEIDVTGPVTR